MKTSRVLCVVSKASESGIVSSSVLKAAMRYFKRDDGFSEERKNG